MVRSYGVQICRVNTVSYLPYELGLTGLGKQCRSRSDITECGICSGFTMFATHLAIFRQKNRMVKWIFLAHLSSAQDELL